MPKLSKTIDWELKRSPSLIDTSGSSDGELYGLQKGKGKGRPSSVLQKVEKQKERERMETAKVGVTVKVGQSERDDQKVKVGTRQAKVGSNKGQQEGTIWNLTRWKRRLRRKP